MKSALTEVYKFLFAAAMTCLSFLAIFFACYVLGVKALDPWLLAGFSIAFGARRFIFGSPSMRSFIDNKENILYSTILIFFQVYAFMSFGVLFLLTTLLAGYNRFKINPVMDVLVALLAPTLIVIYLVILLQKKKKQVHENNL